jgi:asparagine synthase (glutamine-hydrolysing)
MDMEINLENFYFPWNKTERNNQICWKKGDLFYKGKILQGSEIISLFSSLPSSLSNNNDLLKELLLNFNGSFALVIETPNWILCIVDRIRSIPLFYARTDVRFIISDDANFIRNKINPRFNEKNGAEFLVAGYVTGPETLFNGICQLQSGEYLIYSLKNYNLTRLFYHQFWHENYFLYSEKELLEHLDKIFFHVFQRLIDSINSKGLKIVVPLSGGLDSRIIVAWLKRMGIDDVICFSYGRKGNQESNISKQVAEKLNYQWYFIEYTKKKWSDCYHSIQMREYEQYAGNLVSLPVIQDFLAVKILKEEGKIPNNSVFLPGYTGDMLAGSGIPRNIENITQDYDQFINHTILRHYSLCRWKKIGSEKLENIFKGKIRKSVGSIDINNADSLSNIIEFFNFQERQAKFITNSIRIYEYFGYEWRIPLWDAELMDFFLKLKIKYRINQYLYHEYILDFFINSHISILKDIPNSSTKKYITKNSLDIKKRIPVPSFFKLIIKKILWKYKIIMQYFFHPLNWYSIMSFREFLKFYSGHENINTYLSQKYLENTLSPEDMAILLKFF